MNHDRIMSEAIKHNAIIPTQGSQAYELLTSMFDGRKFTVLDAISEKGCYALSQRAGDLVRSGWPVKAEWKTLSNGKRVKEYSL